jgi:hypothetical protein
MARYDVNKHATAETRRRGARGAAAVKRRKRAEAEAISLQRIAELTGSALDKLEQLLDSADDHVTFRAVKEVLDRVLGRPRQALEVSLPGTFDPSLLSDDELAQLEVLLTKSQPEQVDL